MANVDAYIKSRDLPHFSGQFSSVVCRGVPNLCAAHVLKSQMFLRESSQSSWASILSGYRL